MDITIANSLIKQYQIILLKLEIVDSMTMPKLSNIKDNVSEDDDAEYAISGEFTANGYRNNTLKMQKGVIAMERNDYGRQDASLTTQGYNSARRNSLYLQRIWKI